MKEKKTIQTSSEFQQNIYRQIQKNLDGKKEFFLNAKFDTDYK